MFHEAEAENIEVEGMKQNSLFTEGPVINCFVIPPDKYRKYCRNYLLDARAYSVAATRKTNGCQNRAIYTIIVKFFAANKT